MNSRNYRIISLIGFILITFGSQSIWDTFSSVETGVANVLNVNPALIALLIIIYPILFFILTIPSSILLDSNFNFWLLFGSFITFIGGFIRIFSLNYWTMLVCQILAAIGQPFILNAFVTFSSEFFPERKAYILSILSFTMYIGALFPLVTGVNLFSLGGIKYLTLPTGIILFIGIILLILGISKISRNENKDLYSHPENNEKDVKIIKDLIKNKSLWIMGGIMGFGILIYNNLTSWLEPVLVTVGLEELAGYAVAFSIVLGLVGIIILPFMFRKIKNEFLFLNYFTFIGTIIFVLLAFFLNNLVLMILIPISGFLLLPLYVIVLDWIGNRFPKEIHSRVTGLVGFISRALSGLSLLSTVYFIYPPRNYFIFISINIFISFIFSILLAKNNYPYR
ncbi:MAG: MFS transporter [Thermoplasmata archaeon]